MIAGIAMAPRPRIPLAILAVTFMTLARPAAQTPADPLEIARILAARYPAQPGMSYIPALTWSSQLRLSDLTGEPRWREKALKDIGVVTADPARAFAPPHRLTSLAAAFAFADAWMHAKDQAARKLALAIAPFMVSAPAPYDINFTTGWTDDMFMASAVLARTALEAHQAPLQRLLLGYSSRLQRPDGLFIHAETGPHAWGRGNGFALLGLTEALTWYPEPWPRAPVLDIYRRQLAGLVKHQSDDGSWRQVIDEPASYRELTATAMITAAIARGIARGWIDRERYEPVMNRGWQAVAARVNPDGTVNDVCASTGAGPTKEYYLNRPVVNGADDRGGAMALLAAIEMIALRR